MGIKYVIAAAIGLVYESRAALFKALVIPFTIYLLLDLMESVELGAMLAYGVWFLGILAHTIFAVTTHRVVLLGPGSVPKWGIIKWTHRETYFLLHLIGLGLLSLPLFLFLFIPFAGAILGLAIYCWLIGRLSLAFPAIAIDQGVSFRDSWKLTSNHQSLMFLVVIVYPALLAIPEMLVGLIPGTLPLVSIISTLATVFVISALSVSYKVIFPQPGTS